MFEKRIGILSGINVFGQITKAVPFTEISSATSVLPSILRWTNAHSLAISSGAYLLFTMGVLTGFAAGRETVRLATIGAGFDWGVSTDCFAN